MFPFSHPPRLAPPAALFSATLVAALLGFGMFFDHLSQRQGVPHDANLLETLADEPYPSPAVRRLARWNVETRDHLGLPFLVIDKARARLFSFDGQGRLQASSPVLLGAARSDTAEAAATPAGRFVADASRAGGADHLVWLSGKTELRLHAPDSSWLAPGRALQRLASGLADDKRISDGSLHVPPAFYRQHLQPLRSQPSVAYVLPEQEFIP